MLRNSDGSIRGSSRISAPGSEVAGGSSSVRSTTGSVTAMRALLDGGGSDESGSGPVSPIGVMIGVAEVNRLVGMGEMRGVVLEGARDQLI